MSNIQISAAIDDGEQMIEISCLQPLRKVVINNPKARRLSEWNQLLDAVVSGGHKILEYDDGTTCCALTVETGYLSCTRMVSDYKGFDMGFTVQFTPQESVQILKKIIGLIGK